VGGHYFNYAEKPAHYQWSNYRHGKDITYVEYSLCIPNGPFPTGVDLRCSYSSRCYTDTAHPLQHLHKMAGTQKQGRLKNQQMSGPD
jgi:hypothetical protein